MGLGALLLYILGLIVLFGVKSAVQYRTTGSTGFRGVSGRPLSLEWWGGVLFVVALVLGLAGCVLAVQDRWQIDSPAWMPYVGVVLAVVGFATTLAAQLQMGTSWRIGVNPDESTELVSSGMFRWVRNPIFSAMTLALIGIAGMVPSIVSMLAVLVLIAAVQIQVRAVEEPYLLATHGDSYADLQARTGRFLPKFGGR